MLFEVNPSALPKGFTDEDLLLAQHLRQEDDAQVLSPIRDEPLKTVTGVVKCGCADADRFCDVLDHFRMRLPVAGNGKHRIHPVSLAGTALCLIPESPIYEDDPDFENDHGVIWGNIKVGILLKHLRYVILYTHWPCGAALLAGLTLRQSLELFVECKEHLHDKLQVLRLERGIEDQITIASFLDLDVGSSKQLTYKFRCSNLIASLLRWDMRDVSR